MQRETPDAFEACAGRVFQRGVIVCAPYDDPPMEAERVLKDFVGAMQLDIALSSEYARRAQPSS